MSLDPERFDALAASPYVAPLINIGCGEDHTIAELAERVAAVVSYAGPVAWDRSKPDGTFRKILDVSRMQALGWQPTVDLENGIQRAYADFLPSRRS